MPATPPSNLLLDSLSRADRQSFAADLALVPLKLKQVLCKGDESPQYVYFPTAGFCSVVAVLEDGAMVEVLTIGREGGVDLVGMLPGGSIPSMAMVQAEIPAAYRMTAAVFRREMNRHGGFERLMDGYVKSLVGMMMLSTACNAVHSVEQRLARWLLLAHDRIGEDHFPMTQEFVAMMLGATRPTVTLVAGTLQRAGLIKYRHGRVVIVDRARLEAVSCGCYRAATRLLAPARKRHAQTR